MADFKAVLSKLHQNLNTLRERESKFGGNAPLELLNQIEDYQQGIALTEQALLGELGEEAWLGSLRVLAIDQTIPEGNFFQKLLAIRPGDAEKPQAIRQRQAMLRLVREFWVKGVLESSLHGAVLIELGLEERKEAVERPWDMVVQTYGGPDRVLAPASKMVDVFEEAGQSLLILGEPGSGKTSMLLELARDLILRAETDALAPMPVVFNLSSWGEKVQPLADWLVEELVTKYNIPRKTADQWVEQDELLLLLDGLDEVRLDRREDCIKAINRFRQEHWISLAVCSRLTDYEALTTRLKLQGAVLLQPLSLPKIDDYLDRAGPELTTLRAALREDTLLQELAQSPLVLSIMALAYRGVSVESLARLTSIEAHRKYLFDMYVQQMFKRRQPDRAYSPERTVYYLSNVAKRMLGQAQSLFLIERLQPDWLSTRRQRRLYHAGVILAAALPVGLSFGLAGGLPIRQAVPHVAPIFGMGIALSAGLAVLLVIRRAFGLMGSLWVGLAFGLTFGLTSGLHYGAQVGLTAGTFAGLTVALTFFLIGRLTVRTRSGWKQSIEIVETLRWSWPRASVGLMIGAAAGIAFGVIMGRTIRWPIAFNFGLAFGLVSGLIAGLFSGLIPGEVEIKIQPNQGIRRSLGHALLIGLVIAVATGLAIGLASGLAWGYLPDHNDAWLVGVTIGVFVGLGLGLGVALLFGGLAVIQHFSLRLILTLNGSLPWNLVHFLDYCTERIFLRKVGGGYIFIHRLLLEYFASLDEDPATF